MIERYIDIDGYWGILLCFDYDRRDLPRMCSIMESFGLSEYKIIEAIGVLRHRNTGMSISDSGVTMSVMFISPATSLEEFEDTISHEVDHVQDAILKYYDVEHGGEPAAWTQGYITKRITRVLIDEGFLCSPEYR